MIKPSAGALGKPIELHLRSGRISGRQQLLCQKHRDRLIHSKLWEDDRLLIDLIHDNGLVNHIIGERQWVQFPCWSARGPCKYSPRRSDSSKLVILKRAGRGVWLEYREGRELQLGGVGVWVEGGHRGKRWTLSSSTQGESGWHCRRYWWCLMMVVVVVVGIQSYSLYCFILLFHCCICQVPPPHS